MVSWQVRKKRRALGWAEGGLGRGSGQGRGVEGNAGPCKRDVTRGARGAGLWISRGPQCLACGLGARARGPRCLGRGGRAGSAWKALTSHAVSRPLWALASASVPRFLASVNGRSLTSLPPSFLELQLWEAEQEMGSKGSSSAALSSALLLTSPLGHAFAVSWAVPAQGRQLPPKPDVLCGLLDVALLP